MSEENVQQIISNFKHSETIGKLAEALAKAHAAFSPVIKSAENPYFKSSYADLSALIDATQAGLSANGLALVQSPGWIENSRVHVTSMLIHSSGEWLRDELTMPMAKADAQGAGSAITYARRYAFQSLLNVAGEADDDGNAAAGRTQKDAKGSSTDKSEKDGRNINPTQQRAFWAAVKQGGKSNDQVAQYFETIGIENSEDMPKIKLDAAMKWAVTPIVLADDLTPTLQKSLDLATQKPSAQEMKRVFALANAKGIPEVDVKTYSYETYKVDSMTKLTGKQLLEVAEWIARIEA